MYTLKQSQTARPLMFLMVLTSDHISGATGLSPTVTLSKNGGTFAAPTGAVSEVANGWYKVAGNATDSNTTGPLALHATAGTADPSDTVYNVVGYDPDDAVRMGLTALPNVASGSAGAIPTTGTGSNQITVTSGQVQVQSGTGSGQINLSSGNVGVQSGTSANQISLSSGLVTLAAVTHTGAVIPSVTTVTGNVNGSVGSVTGAVGSVTGNVGGSVNSVVVSPVLASGTASAGGANTITLQTAVGANNLPNGAHLSITGGTGAGQTRGIIGYIDSTKVATVDRPFTVTPDNTSVYVISGGQVQPILTLNTGIAQTGSTSTTIKLASGASATDNLYNECSVQIVGGTGVGQIRVIDGYVGSTVVATVDRAWSTTPDNTSIYVISLANLLATDGFGNPAGITAGTASAGAASTITLVAPASATANIYNGATVVITAGTGAGQSRVITGYTTGRVATVDRAWQTNPDSTSAYLVMPGDEAATDVNLAVATNGVTGNVSGSVASVTGAVGSVTGNVGGNVVGSTGSVTGAVGSVTGNVGGNVVGSVASVTGAVTVGTNNDKGGYGLSTLESFVLASGTASAGAASTITLAGASATDSLYNGAVVKVYGGTGAGQARVVTGYVGSTKVATVDRAWSTNPDNTSTFAVLSLDAPKLDASLQTTAASVQGNVTGSVGSVTGAAGSVTGAVGSVSGNVGGNVVGSVASVTGAVGSVSGNVGGNVVGSTASVTGAVGSVTGNVGGNVVGSVASVTNAVTLATADSPAVTSGTASAGAGSTITLVSPASTTASIYNGATIKITAGTGAGQTRVITGYTTGRVATVDRAWQTNPDNTSVYTVLATDHPATDASLQVTLGTNNDKTGYALTAGEETAIATAIMKLDVTGITGEASHSPLNALRLLRNRWVVSGGTLTVYKEDNATTAWTETVVGTAGSAPITSTSG